MTSYPRTTVFDYLLPWEDNPPPRGPVLPSDDIPIPRGMASYCLYTLLPHYMLIFQCLERGELGLLGSASTI